MQVTLANWRSSPFNRWAFHHVRELIPSADIANDPRADPGIAGGATHARVRIDPDSGEALDLDAFLRETDTDGIAILHRGKLVFERYANGMTDETPHILMSVSKSMLGLLVGRARPRCRAAGDRRPAGARAAPPTAARRSGICSTCAPAWSGTRTTSRPRARSSSTARRPAGIRPSEPPSDLHSFYATLKESDRPHGGRFHYTSPNSDLLGWVIERATGARYADLMSELVWKPAGAERSAYITVDRLGAPRCAGGMCTTLRDLARVGLWVLEQGRTERFEREGDPQGVGGRRHGAVLPRPADALPQQMVRACDGAGAACLRHGHPRPEPVRRPRERARDRQVLLAGGADGRARASRSPCARYRS